MQFLIGELPLQRTYKIKPYPNRVLLIFDISYSLANREIWTKSPIIYKKTTLQCMYSPIGQRLEQVQKQSSSVVVLICDYSSVSDQN